jgi:hypothetical protein
MAIWYNLWPFGIVCGHLLYFSPIWNVRTKKNLATLRREHCDRKKDSLDQLANLDIDARASRFVLQIKDRFGTCKF